MRSVAYVFVPRVPAGASDPVLMCGDLCRRVVVHSCHEGLFVEGRGSDNILACEEIDLGRVRVAPYLLLGKERGILARVWTPEKACLYAFRLSSMYLFRIAEPEIFNVLPMSSDLVRYLGLEVFCYSNPVSERSEPVTGRSRGALDTRTAPCYAAPRQAPRLG
jgi:hypothetical protein